MMRRFQDLEEKSQHFLEKQDLVRDIIEIGTEYTNEPEDEPDQERKANGEPPFLHQTLKDRKEIKNIIISDKLITQRCSDYSYNARKLANLYRYIARMGCKIYFWDGSKLNPYDPEKDYFGYDFFYHIKNMPSVMDDREILKAGVKQKLSPYSLKLADSHFNESLSSSLLLSGFKLEEEIKVTDLPLIKSALYENSKAQYLRIGKFMAMCFEPLNLSIDEEKGIPLFENLYALELGSVRQKECISIINQSPKLNFVSFEECVLIEPSEISTLEKNNLQTLQLRFCTITTDSLNALLKASPNLHYLILNSPKITGTSVIRLPPSIKMLDLNMSDNDKISFQLITPQIGILKLSYVQKGQEEELTSKRLAGLKSFQATIGSGVNLHKILAALPLNLTNLSLDSHYLTYDDIFELLDRFPSLESISLKLINSPMKAMLIQKFPQIQFFEDADDYRSYRRSRATEGVGSISERAPVSSISSFWHGNKPSAQELKLNSNTNPDHNTYRDPILFKTNSTILDNTCLYRLRVYNGMDESITPKVDYHWKKYEAYKKIQNLESEYEQKSSLEPTNYAYSIVDLSPDPTQNQILFSLSGNEKITHIEIIPHDSDAKIEIFYDADTKERAGTRLYSVKVTSDKPIKLKYLLEVNRIMYNEALDIDKDIKEIINHFKSYQPGELKIKAGATQKELLEAIKKNKAGACLHRSLACFHTLLQESIEKGYHFNLLGNSSHAFIEIIEPTGRVITVDLGGAPASVLRLPFQESQVTQPLLSIPSENPLELSHEEQKEIMKYEKRKFSLPFESNTRFFKTLRDIAKKPLMLTFPTGENIQSFINEATDHLLEEKVDLCYLDNLDDFNNKLTKFFIEKAKNTEALEMILFIRLDNDKEIKPHHVGLNSIYDIPPMWNGKLLPKNLKIVALKEEKSEIMEDIRSRFQGRIIPIPAGMKLPSSDSEISRYETKKDKEPANIVNLYEKFEWEKLLIGTGFFKDGNYLFNPGKLLQLIDIAKNTTEQIELRIDNPPWHLPAFKVFWNKLCKEKRVFADGKYHNLPKNLDVTWTTHPFIKPTHVKFFPLDVTNSHLWTHVLNQETFKRFSSFTVSKKGGIDSVSGYLRQHESQVLNVLVTEKLSTKQFEELFDIAKDVRCQLNFIVAPGFKLSEELTGAIGIPIPLEHKESPISIITTNDVNYVSELEPSEILTVGADTTYTLVDHWVESTNSSEKKETRETTYINEEGLLLRLLKAEGTVTLKGSFSPSLLKRLETIFADPPYLEHNGVKIFFGEKQPLKGKLRIICDNNPFPFVKATTMNINPEDYWKSVPEDKASLLKSLCAQLNIKIQYFSQIKSMLANLERNPEKNPAEWLLLLSQTPEQDVIKGQQVYEKLLLAHKVHKPPGGAPATVVEKEKKQDEIEKHIVNIISRLNTLPYLFLIGPAGTGKTTTVLHELKLHYEQKGEKVRIFSTTPPIIDNITAWGQADKGTNKILFIDEANLTAEELYIFIEGMQKKPPKIVYKGEEIILTDKDKVIFAGNYQYYNNRHLQSLFMKVDCIYHYPRFSQEYIQEKMIIPVIAKAYAGGDAETQRKNADLVMDFFNTSTDLARKISPRVNLTQRNHQAMALVFVKLWNNKALLADKPETERLEILAKWAFFQNARDLLGSKSSLLITELFGTQGQYNELKKQFPRQAREDILDVYITSIHKRAVAMLKDEMQTRELRTEISKGGLSVGTRALLLEGPSGVGKSSVVKNCLHALGFNPAPELPAREEKSTESPKIYYHITPTDPEIMKKTLIKAFHEGAVVIIDEINTLPLEGLLNSLLMGFDPNGYPPKREGFYVIGTQNSISFGGRNVLSEALENRFRKHVLNDYSIKDLQKFFAAKYSDVPADISILFAKKYVIERKKSNNYNFRDLLADMDAAQDQIRQAKSLGAMHSMHDSTDESTLVATPEDAIPNKQGTDSRPL